jgi:hypothetical protein
MIGATGRKKTKPNIPPIEQGKWPLDDLSGLIFISDVSISREKRMDA